jgi:hypothetical protein
MTTKRGFHIWFVGDLSEDGLFEELEEDLLMNVTPDGYEWYDHSMKNMAIDVFLSIADSPQDRDIMVANHDFSVVFQIETRRKRVPFCYKRIK